jgi:uncharacterized Zn finger protein
MKYQWNKELVFWKDKQDWQTVGKITKSKKRGYIYINIINEKGDINEIQSITKEYFENLYANILESFQKMDKFLDTYNLEKLNQ